MGRKTGRGIVIWLAVMTLLAGCGREDTQTITDVAMENAYFEGIVLEKTENSILVEPLEGTSERNSADRIWVSTQGISEEKSLETLEEAEAGDKVGITYDGMIGESYPAQISGASMLQMVEKAGEETEKEEGKGIEEKAENGIEIGNAAGTGTEENQVQVSETGVGILAHVKEIQGNEILVSSDSDDFPGVFQVEVPENVYDISKLSGGADILLLMQEKEEKDSAGASKYLAVNIVIRQDWEDVDVAEGDVLLTKPPVFALKDLLSSTYAVFEIQSGNYSWNYMENGEMLGVVAGGAHPMDDGEKNTLELPEYQNMSTVGYTFSTVIAPDTLIVRKWNAEDAGNTEAEEISVITYYYRMPILELEPGRIYEFTAVWKEENAKSRGFYGEASYVVAVE